MKKEDKHIKDKKKTWPNKHKSVICPDEFKVTAYTSLKEC